MAVPHTVVSGAGAQSLTVLRKDARLSARLARRPFPHFALAPRKRVSPWRV